MDPRADVHDHPHAHADRPLIHGCFDREIPQVQVSVPGLVHSDGRIGGAEARALAQRRILDPGKLDALEMNVEPGQVWFGGHTSAFCPCS